MRRWLAAICCSLLAAGTAGAAGAADEPAFFDKLLVLGTGTLGGAFLPIGESVCEEINLQRQSQRIRCVAAPTAGSIYNINAVANGRLQLGLAQEDLVLDHLAGRRGPGFEDLRLVAVLHHSPVSVIVRRSTGVERLDQIKGLRLNMGNRGSGQFTVSTALIQALGLSEADFASVLYEPTSAFEKTFCGGAADVVLEIVPHPVEVFEKLLGCGGRFLEIPEDVAERFMQVNTAFRPMHIAAGSYAGQLQDVRTVGVRNLLISHTRVSTESVARFVRILNQRSAALKQRQPLLATMTPVEPNRDAQNAQGAQGVRVAREKQGPQPIALHDGVWRASSL